MNAFAPLLAALAIVQAPPPEPHPAAEPAERVPAAKEPAAAPAKEPAAAPVKDPAAAPAERAAAPKEPAAPRAEAPAPSPSAATTTARPARAPKPSAQPALISTTAPSPRPSPPARAGGEGVTTGAAPRAPQHPDAEREDAERAARAFLDALLARDADALAAASAERFSFDGDAQAGREAIRRTWRAILAGREGAPPRLGSVEILPAADAVTRFGKPPARLATLARPGVLVAVADVGGRTVVLFLAKEAGRMAVLGMHD